MFELQNMAKVSNGWKSSVVDFTRRNSLLVFKPGTSTIRIGKAAQQAIDSLLEGKTISLPSLMDSDNNPEETSKAAESLLKKQRYLLEELGVSPINLAIGFARWQEPALPEDKKKSQLTNAPVFLLPLEIERRKTGGDAWKIRATQELKINGVLVHAAESAGIKFDDEHFLDEFSEKPNLENLRAKLTELEERLKGLSALTFVDERYLAAFSYQDEAIYRDLSDISALFESEVVRALAGDGDAIIKLQDLTDVPVDMPDWQPPASENLILDADASQIQAINSALSGNTLVIEGPPGTGKSQTISNLLAECLAQDKKVLFVAQKRAAIDAVLKRLAEKGLDALVLDVHETSRGREVAAQLGSSYKNMRQTPPVDLNQVHDELRAARDQLVGMKNAFVSEPRGLGLNLADLCSLYYSIPRSLVPEWKIDVNLVSELSREDHLSVQKAILALAESGGLNSNFERASDSWNVNKVRSRAELSALIESSKSFDASLVKRLAQLAGEGASSLSPVRKLVQDARRTSLDGWLQTNAKKLVRKKRKGGLIAALGKSRGLKSETQVTLGTKLWGSIAAPFLLPKQHSTAVQALECYAELLSTDARRLEHTKIATSNNSDWDEALATTAFANTILDSVQGLNLDSISGQDFVRHVGKLALDAKQFKIATYWENFNFLVSKGFSDFIEQVKDEAARRDFEEEDFGKLFDAAASRALIESALTSDSRIQGLDADSLQRISERFRKFDKKHLEQNALKIKRIAATNFKFAVDSFPQESTYLEREAGKQRAHKPLRTSIIRAPNLMLAANPIWAMSPIQVASYLPRKQMFDLVIFDEASQVKPEMAIPSIMRGRTIVVAGDSNQLPPTNFFSGGGLDLIDEEIEDVEVESATKDSESILEAMERIVGSRRRRLLWHYRSRDERLITLSNIEIYDNSLTTFPASDSVDAVRHELVPPGKNKKVASGEQNDEVQHVLSLIARHSREHPDESLGVITFGINNLKRLEMALARARTKDPDLDSWLDGHLSEPFFLKNLERVQGDERDAIIISTGYGKDSSGKMNLRWGPLNSENGRRRLNVAISRAKRRMTLVTNFSLAELAEQKVREGTGVELFKKFLDYMGNEGTSYQHSSSLIPLNPFEIDVKRKLEAQGLSLVSQFGVGNYRIDFAVRDPRNPNQFLLAVEADGASYHSSHIARERDRLRQMLLESRGWRFHRIWSTEWFRDSDSEVQRVMDTFHSALEEDSTKFPKEEPNRVQGDTSEKPRRTLERPPSGDGGDISDYSDSRLDGVIAYIQSDGLLRDNLEIMAEARKILGFKKDGSRIRSRLESAIRRANQKN